uniref:Gelsolin, cytoplasmic n=1 Tax=Halocynthia roretzi TaxID=7729 RepID=GELS_HALRO|nr:RecName: Full=Gelsolin, cytoplasmic; AltName: Full=Actin-depolymerizing factor; Short=ADF; AltName: Full=Ascidian gelsolin [Halocynthia roretzi]BAA28674.1 ascidian cytoplasmic gelsolin [Halocynthia roretzi]
MTTELEIQKAGKETGIQIWRIEDFELVPVPKTNHGKFYTGDSYIILKTTALESGRGFEWNLHYWQGKESSQDERGAVAILAVKMDDHLNGGPVEHREVQGNESAAFKGLFPTITYLIGGVASGFTHVEINEVEDRKVLTRVKGKRPVRATQVPIKWTSLTDSDSYVFDIGKEIYVWSGPKASHFEKNKAIQYADGLKNERQGRAELHHIDSLDDKESRTMLKDFFGEAFPGSIPSGESDTVQQVGTTIKLFRISDDSGTLKITLVSENSPFNQGDLSSGDTFVLANARTNHIFVWKGKDSSRTERASAANPDNSFFNKIEMPLTSKLTVLPEGGETANFKSLFTNWKSSRDQRGLGQVHSINKTAKVAKETFDASVLHSNPKKAAESKMIDDGSGKTQIWRVASLRKEPVPKELYGQFYGGDCYIIMYTPQRGANVLYYWQGNKASINERTALPIQTKNTHETECDGNASQIRVVQGTEPPHMMMLFGGKPLIVHLGDTISPTGKSKAASTRLYQVQSFFAGRCRAVEVPAKSSHLNSNDAFLLITPSGSYIWVGKGAVESEIQGAKDTAGILKISKYEIINENQEPNEFWTALGGQSDYWRDEREEGVPVEPRLFEMSNATGNFIAEEINSNYVQSDLNPDSIMMLDAWNYIYVWIGKEANQEEKMSFKSLVDNYVKTDGSGRSKDIPREVFDQGKEPLSFTGHFLGWDKTLWD